MRLIDADALKVALKNNCKPEICHDYNTAWCESCCRTNDFEDLIDDAPTVPMPDFKEGYKQAIIDGKINYSRPQGEWIKQYNKSYELKTNEGILVGEFTKCPKCQYDKARGSNYCPNCGADMRKGDEE